MNKYKVTILPMGKEIYVEEGTSLLEAQRLAGLRPDAPCGGNGTCGKCIVEIISDGESRIDKACSNFVKSDTIIKVKVEESSHHLLMEGIKRQVDIASSICNRWIKINPPIAGESDSEWDRIKKKISDAAGVSEEEVKIDISLLSGVYDMLIDNKYMLNMIMHNNEVIDIKSREVKKYVMAFDIGTTSIVGYLLDADTARQAATVSMLNPQTQFGGDVINRSNYAIENGIDHLSSVVRAGLNELITSAAKEAKIKKSDIYMVTIVGNTCMHHLLLGISPKALVQAPYIPVLSNRLELKAADIDLEINSRGKALILPNIAGFVGADTAGVLLATDFDHLEPLTLAIDIGTNGELVMGNKKAMIACSTAAGPAFEGARIKMGMRGKEGAVEHVRFNGNEMEYSVIGNVKPIGICGSGLMDVMAVLIEEGFVDDSGKLLGAEELTMERAIQNKDRLVEEAGEKRFIIYKGETDSDHVYVTQKDIREVQLAKAAMAAGISMMAAALKVKVEDIQQVMIAGAFGNYMSPHSACKIGLIPETLEDRIIPVGNAAGEGAKIAALNYKEFARSEEITDKVMFLELAAESEFQDCFVDHLGF